MSANRNGRRLSRGNPHDFRAYYRLSLGLHEQRLNSLRVQLFFVLHTGLSRLTSAAISESFYTIAVRCDGIRREWLKDEGSWSRHFVCWRVLALPSRLLPHLRWRLLSARLIRRWTPINRLKVGPSRRPRLRLPRRPILRPTRVRRKRRTSQRQRLSRECSPDQGQTNAAGLMAAVTGHHPIGTPITAGMSARHCRRRSILRVRPRRTVPRS